MERGTVAFDFDELLIHDLEKSLKLDQVYMLGSNQDGGETGAPILTTSGQPQLQLNGLDL